MYCTGAQYSIAYQIPDRALSRFYTPIFPQSTSCVTSSSFGRQYSAVKIKPVKLQYSTAKYQPLQSPEIEIRKHGMDIIVCSPLFTPKHIVVTKISIQFLLVWGNRGIYRSFFSRMYDHCFARPPPKCNYTVEGGGRGRHR